VTILTFQFSAGAQQTWTVEKDWVLMAVSQSGSVVVSYDKSDSITNFFTPTATGWKDSVVMGSNSTAFKSGLGIQIAKGDVIYISMSAAGSTQLFLEEAQLKI
jgi:hypothetical protein